MIHSKRSLEGELVIDHRNSPGITEADIKQAGLDPAKFPNLSAGSIYSSATISCTHCQAVVILNPLRSRPRNYCAHCDHYICDNPTCILMSNGGLPHRTVTQVMEELSNDAVKATQVKEI